MGTEPIAEFCREIEAYLCRKNDGHLIRVVGPSFELVSGWASQGIPIKVAYEGIDRYFERYYRKGPRRRPVKIDFCEADVLDVFDEWRKATGITAPPERRPVEAVSETSATGSTEASGGGHESLPRHLERVVARLTNGRASGALDAGFDALIDRAAALLDEARAKAGGLRGDARSAAIAKLADIDAALVTEARARIDAETMAAMWRQADADVAPFRGGMTAEAYLRARDAAVDRLVRGRYRLPIVAFA